LEYAAGGELFDKIGLNLIRKKQRDNLIDF
jgi:hypothetical protein